LTEHQNALIETALPYLKQLLEKENRDHAQQVHPTRGRSEYMTGLQKLIMDITEKLQAKK
jgi:hypothetical protein